jgi:hypothetical protein
MFHPDQRYDLRTLQHQDLLMEATRMRMAAQVGEARNGWLAPANRIIRTLAQRLSVWLRPARTHARISKG